MPETTTSPEPSLGVPIGTTTVAGLGTAALAAAGAIAEAFSARTPETIGAAFVAVLALLGVIASRTHQKRGLVLLAIAEQEAAAYGKTPTAAALVDDQAADDDEDDLAAALARLTHAPVVPRPLPDVGDRDTALATASKGGDAQ